MKKILLSISIAVMLLSNPQQSFAMKQQDEDIKITEKIIKKYDRDEFTETKEKNKQQKRMFKKRKKIIAKVQIKESASKLFGSLSNLASNMQTSKYTGPNLDFVLGDVLSKKIKEHNKLEKLLTNNIVDNIFKIRFDLPFTPTTEELKTIELIKNKNDFPAPDKELENLTENKPNSLSIKFLSWLFPKQVDNFYQSFGKILWAFAANNVREKHVARCIYEKYLAISDKYYISKTLAGHTSWISCLAVLPNGNIVTGSGEQTAKIWNPATGNCIQTLAGPNGHIYAINCIAVLPNGNIVTGSWDHSAKIWDSNGNYMQTLAGSPNGHTHGISCIAVLPNDNIVTGSWDHTAKIWDSSGNFIQTLDGPNGHTDEITCIAVLPNGNIVTGSRDNTTKIWDSNGNFIQTLDGPNGHSGAISCIAVLPNGNIVTGSGDNTAKIWDSNGNCIQTLDGPNGHSGAISCIAVLPKQGKIVTGSVDHTAKIWDSNGNYIQTLAGPNGHTDAIQCIAVFPKKGKIVTGSVDHTAKIWDSNGNYIQTLAGPNGHTSRINCIAVFPKGKIITVSQDKTAKIWNPIFPYTSNVMSMALAACFYLKKNDKKTIPLDNEWQEVFDKLPVSKDIKDDLKTVFQ